MSAEVTDRSEATEPPVLAVEPHGAPGAPRRRPGVARRIWSFLTSMRTGLVIILILGALTLMGTLFMQAPDSVRADPTAYQRWYASGPRLKYGGWAPIMDALGLFHVFSTWYFVGLFALLAVSILACSINRAPKLWRAATRPRVSMDEGFYSRAPLHAQFVTQESPRAAAERVAAAFKGKHFRTLERNGADGTIDVYADKFRWAPFGTVVAHLSFVIILAGFVVSGSHAFNGFKDDDFVAPVGVPVPVGHDTGLTLEAVSFTDSYYPDGRPKDYMSDLVLTKDGQQVARQETRVNTPLIYDGIWFHQAFFGVGADISVTKDGQPLASQTVPLQPSDDGQQNIGRFEVPGTTTIVWVVQAASGQVLPDLPAGAAGLEIHTSATANPVYKVINQGGSVTVDGVEYSFDRNREYTGLIVARDNGSPLVWTGSIMLILGSYLVFFLPFRRVWVRIRPDGETASVVQVGATVKRDPAFEPTFADLVSTMSNPDSDNHDKEL